ncbi:MAG: hypothetical protein ABW090_04280 [Sedimenticola sp.]
MGDMKDSYHYLKLREILDLNVDPDALNDSLREYLLNKYITTSCPEKDQ